LRCTICEREGTRETLEDKGDKGDSTEKEKYIYKNGMLSFGANPA
jgi:hypothetical protein